MEGERRRVSMGIATENYRTDMTGTESRLSRYEALLIF